MSPADCHSRFSMMKISALASDRRFPRVTDSPPATSTRPSAKTAATWPLRLPVRVPAAVQLPSPGSKTSAVDSDVSPLVPPTPATTITVRSGSLRATWLYRASPMSLDLRKLSTAGS